MSETIAEANGVHRPERVEVSVVLPCLNEAETLGLCIAKARGCLTALGLSHEIIVSDNGSEDSSQMIAERNGAKVVTTLARGYGNAIRAGLAVAAGRYVIVGDADNSYDFADLRRFVERLMAGCELVVGNRFRGGIKPGAMPSLHRYVGNPVLNGIGRVLFRTPCHDFHCGLRGFDRCAMEGVGLRATGMEFASEMVVKASLCRLRMAEVPTTLAPDGRGRRSHLRPWRDGWRHLRLMLACRWQGWRESRTARSRVDTPPLCIVRGAFTLIEALIVIGIVAAVMGIMLPAIGKVRAEARRASCLSNLRQLEQGWLSYASGHDGQGIPYARHSRGVWIEKFRSEYGNKDAIRFCPAAQAQVSPDFGSATASWTYDLGEGSSDDRRSGSYGLNGWLLSWDPVGQAGTRYSGGTAAKYLKMTSAETAVVPVFGDATWADAWPREEDPTPPNLADGDRSHQGPEQAPRENMMAQFTIDRHGGRVNIAFLDGHGESVALAELKRLKWHEKFVYQDWSPSLPTR